jgi:glycosyltransferase involved in cell wall biosynthesis
MQSLLTTGAAAGIRLPKVCAIVRSTGDRTRAELLKRAVASILTQTGIDVECIVVFNGSDYDDSLLAWTQAQRHTRTFVLDCADKALATLMGRAMVRGDFFCFLDDDDQYLPGALAFRANYLAERPLLDCVATNGYYVSERRVRPVFAKADRFARDGYVESLLHSRNWLASCGGMFRASTVPAAYFTNLTRHREWTLIAYRIATDLRVEFVNRLGYRVYNLAGSQSKRSTYVDAGVEVLDAMLAWPRGARYAAALRRQKARAYRGAASYYRIYHDFGRAWSAYWHALRSPGGWRHAPYGALLMLRVSRPVEDVLRNGVTSPGFSLGWRLSSLIAPRRSAAGAAPQWRVFVVAVRPVAVYCLAGGSAALCRIGDVFSKDERDWLREYCERGQLDFAELTLERGAHGNLDVVACERSPEPLPAALPLSDRLALLRRFSKAVYAEYVAPVRERRRFAKDMRRWLQMREC